MKRVRRCKKGTLLGWQTRGADRRVQLNRSVVLAIVLVLFGIVLGEGVVEVVVPPASVGPIGAVWGFGAVLFLTNLFGGLVGGKLGEPFYTDAQRLE
jgi:hypothetical protein